VNQTSEPLTVTGGPGADQLFGGSGDDSIDGQDDADTLMGGYGNDDMRGGSGADAVTYSYASYPIYADIDGNADDGAYSGHDNVRTDVENLIGGKGHARLTGNAGSNVLSGGEGNDTVYGGEGADALTGGAGRDTLRGESGDDSLDSLDGLAESPSCGDGADSLLADPSDELIGDCETVSYGVVPPPPAPAPQPVKVVRKVVRVTSDWRALLRLHCTRVARGSCTGSVKLTAPSRAKAKASKRATRHRRSREVVLGRARFSVRSGRLATVKVRLSRNGRRRVVRRRRVRCRVSVAVRDARGVRRTVTGVVTLKAPEVTQP
jgi:RTX calcium-binding nonapeptide repeat (4 copies)